MALLSSQLAAVRMYLGYERGFDLNPRLESKLVALSADEEAQVVAVLAKLAALDARIDTVATNGTLEAGKITDTELRDGDPLELYARQGRRLVARLAILCAVDVGRDYYASDGGASMGGVIPLG